MWVRVLFAIAAAYDGVLGLTFLLVPNYPFEFFQVAPPNHLGYVQFPAALLLIFALMFLAIARDPVGRRDLIPYGFLLKAAYCGLAFSYWLAQDIPGMWKPFAVIDIVMAALFAWAYVALGKPSRVA